MPDETATTAALSKLPGTTYAVMFKADSTDGLDFYDHTLATAGQRPRLRLFIGC
jgi:hypothetical protein